MRGLAYACVVACALLGCGDRTFVCTQPGDCDGGMCTPQGYCSFPDGDCPSGQRYGRYAGHLSGACVEPSGGSTGVGEDTAASTPTSADSSPGSETFVLSDAASTAELSTTSVSASTSSGAGEDDVCPLGLELCTNGCVDTMTDSANCGGCDLPCLGDCVAGKCVLSKIVFVTSGVFNGAFGGLDAADEACQDAAFAANVPGTFMAWLSDDTGNPVTRMTGNDGPYVLVDGTLVAENWDELRDGELLVPIALTELGTDPLDGFVCSGQEVWTNTTALGSLSSSVDDCNNWSSSMASGVVGRWSQLDERWTEDQTCPGVGCSSGLPIYCVEQ